MKVVTEWVSWGVDLVARAFFFFFFFVWGVRFSGQGSISIGSSSPVSRSSPSGNYILFFPFFCSSPPRVSLLVLARLCSQPEAVHTHTYPPSPPLFSMCLRRQGRGSRDFVLGFTYQEVWPAKLCRLRARPLPKNISGSIGRCDHWLLWLFFLYKIYLFVVVDSWLFIDFFR